MTQSHQGPPCGLARDPPASSRYSTSPPTKDQRWARWRPPACSWCTPTQPAKDPLAGPLKTSPHVMRDTPHDLAIRGMVLERTPYQTTGPHNQRNINICLRQPAPTTKNSTYRQKTPTPVSVQEETPFPDNLTSLLNQHPTCRRKHQHLPRVSSWVHLANHVQQHQSVPNHARLPHQTTRSLSLRILVDLCCVLQWAATSSGSLRTSWRDFPTATVHKG